MQLRFEKWFQNQRFKEEVNELFNESVLCYKVGAYKAAIITSYLGIQTLLKLRIVNSGMKPDNFNENHWERIIKDLEDDSMWDNTVFDCVNRTQPNNPFLITEDLRSQYSYWRTIRNDCAHAKNNLISHSHVESIWLFIEANIHKFLINGGRNGLIEKIRRHYDIIYTPKGESEEYLVLLIPNIIKKSEISDFLKEIRNVFSTELHEHYISERKQTFNFWRFVAQTENDDLRNGFIQYLKTDFEEFFEFIEKFPELFTYILEDEEFIRELWVDKLWEYFAHYRKIGWKIIDILLKNNKVTSDEYSILTKNLVKLGVIPPSEMIESLRTIEYFQRLKSVLFESGNLTTMYSGINYGNSNWDRIAFYIKNNDLDECVVRELNSVFKASSYGTFHDGFKLYLSNNPTFKEKFKEIAVENGYSLSDLFNEGG